MNVISRIMVDVREARTLAERNAARRAAAKAEAQERKFASYKLSLHEDGSLYIGPILRPVVSDEVLKRRVRVRGQRYSAGPRTARSIRSRMYGMFNNQAVKKSDLTYHFMTLTVPRHTKYCASSYEFDRLATLARNKFVQNLKKNYGMHSYIAAAERQSAERKDNGVARRAIHWHIVIAFDRPVAYKHLAFVCLATLARHGFNPCADVCRTDWYRARYGAEINRALGLFFSRQYRLLMDEHLDVVPNRYRPVTGRKNIFLLGCLDMRPVVDVSNTGAISSYLSSYMSSDRKDGVYSYRVTGTRGLKLGKEGMCAVMSRYLELKTGKKLLYPVEETVWRRPLIDGEREDDVFKCVDHDLVYSTRKVKVKRRDPDGSRIVPEKVVRWVFDDKSVYEIQSYWNVGGNKVYSGHVGPPCRWRKNPLTGVHEYRESEGYSFDYFSFNSNMRVWELDDLFQEVLKEFGFGRKRDLYYEHVGAPAPCRSSEGYTFIND